MEIRKANSADVSLILENRMEFISNVVKEGMPEGFEKNTYEYLRKHIADNSLVAWLAVDNEKIVSIAVICFYDVLPTVSNISGKTGYILNVYTLEEYRRQGLAKRLLSELINEAKELYVGKIYLNATDDGRKVYEKMNFEVLTREMELKIN